ncbi:class I SAM-dependent methyltransferase [Thalassococcus sp. CAU 1522]|uniref:Class I SAM-dependent methyltransferase n=1 Tax=Thalassococcus arenae TaxID=2851652 RepID=A0ABS6N876_9RHOB|nr:class I SAM-dependent methyltransferase [Thalassococcus arenae]MBV2360209.1 class I SAM-dependent methyltransferase [Thalassococcus arenae]
MTRKPDLDSAYALDGPEDNRRLYAEWAETYDSDFAEAMAYRLPQAVAEGFVRTGGRGPVIDLGAGTGLCGAALAGLGIGPVDGTDLSPEMLARAGRRGCYARLFPGDLLDRLPVADGAYAGAVSSGTFTHGHVGPEALDEVLRVVRPGGWVVLSVNAAHWRARGFADAFAALADRIAGLGLPEVPIYDAGTGTHARDRAILATFRKA